MNKPSLLVLNEDPKPGHIQNLVLNLLPKLVRHDKMEDRNFLVVPMIILTEGVHAGSDGPMLYPKEELSKTPVVWNHKPVVVYHPEMNGQGISACDPSVITNRKVGVMMNTKFEKGKLKSEAWIEVDRANAVDERIMAAIEANQMMELSTGVFVDMEAEPGEWKGEAYVGIARNYRPDHLALLPDKIGACSIKDGAGFLRNAAECNPKYRQVMERMMRELGLLDNEMSHGNIRDGLTDALRKKFNTTNDLTGPSLWVNDVYEDFVIYELGGKLFRLGYSATDTGVTLSKETPAPVVRVTEYRTVEGAFVGNQTETKNKDKRMNKKELVDSIITANAGYKEEDRTALMDLTENQLESMAKFHGEFPTVNFTMEKGKDGKASLLLKQAAPQVQNVLMMPKQGEAKSDFMARCTAAGVNDKATCTAMFDKMAATKNEEPKTEQAPKAVLNLQEYIAAAPPEVAAVLNNSIQVYDEEKAKLIDSIVANKNNPFSKEDLANRPLGELRGLARLAGVTAAPRPQAHYGGQASVPSDNAEQEEAMEIPSMNFAKS